MKNYEIHKTFPRYNTTCFDPLDGAFAYLLALAEGWKPNVENPQGLVGLQRTVDNYSS